MSNLEKLLEANKLILMTGPHGSELAKRTDLPKKLQEGCGCAALQDIEQGIPAVQEISLEYLTAVPTDQIVALLTPTFRTDAANIAQVAPGQGKLLFDRAVQLSVNAIEQSGRLRDLTPVVASIGPPFDCYKAEDTPHNVEALYISQVSAALHNSDVSYLLFETVPSIQGALGAVIAYNRVQTGEINGYVTDLKRYIAGSEDEIYVKSRGLSEPDIGKTADKGYIVSFCLEKDGTVEGIPLEAVIHGIDNHAFVHGLIAPTGYGINCNSYGVTEKALESLSSESKERVVQIHMNAHPEDDPRNYEHIDPSKNRSAPEMANYTVQLQKKHDIPIIGGCCGTDPFYLELLTSHTQTNTFTSGMIATTSEPMQPFVSQS